MKYLIVGYGSIGRRHLRNLRQLGRENLVLLRSHKSTLPDDEIAGIPVETEMEAALAHKPGGVIIANPTALHLDAAIPAAEAGCSILMEKPLCGSPEQIASLKTALNSHHGRFLMGFQYRFHPGLKKVLELLNSGLIGRPLSFRADWGEYLPDWHPWEDYRKSYSARSDLGGGVALTLCHPVDYIRWMFGSISALWGFSGKISDLEINVDDIAEIGLHMQNGMVGTIHLDYYRRPVCNRLEVTATEGVLTWNNEDAMVTVYPASSGEPQKYPPQPGFERNQLFLDETRHFIDITENGAAPLCTLEDGLVAEKMINSLRRSWSEKRIIEFPEGN